MNNIYETPIELNAVSSVIKFPETDSVRAIMFDTRARARSRFTRADPVRFDGLWDTFAARIDRSVRRDSPEQRAPVQSVWTALYAAREARQQEAAAIRDPAGSSFSAFRFRGPDTSVLKMRPAAWYASRPSPLSSQLIKSRLRAAPWRGPESVTVTWPPHGDLLCINRTMLALDIRLPRWGIIVICYSAVSVIRFNWPAKRVDEWRIGKRFRRARCIANLEHIQLHSLTDPSLRWNLNMCIIELDRGKQWLG